MMMMMKEGTLDPTIVERSSEQARGPATKKELRSQAIKQAKASKQVR
jgi:hypothetical protein